MNLTVITGRLVRDPEKSTTQDGKSKTAISVAVDRDYKPKGAQYPEADFFYCIAYDRTADFIAEHFAKGRPIELYLQYRQYKKEDKTSGHFFLVDKAKFVPRDNTGKGDIGDMNDSGYLGAETDVQDDDLPF